MFSTAFALFVHASWILYFKCSTCVVAPGGCAWGASDRAIGLNEMVVLTTAAAVAAAVVAV